MPLFCLADRDSKLSLYTDFTVENVARAKNQSETRSWNDFDPEAYAQYGEDQNRETSVAARFLKSQQVSTAKSGLKVNEGYDG